MAYSQEIFSRIEAFVKDQKWANLTEEDKGHIMIRFWTGKKVEFVELHFYVAEHGFTTYVDFLTQVEDTAREQMLELLTRINFRIRYGNFELKTQTNKVGYRYAVDCQWELPSRAIIKNSVTTGFDVVKRFADAIAEVSAGEVTARDAYAAVSA